MAAGSCSVACSRKKSLVSFRTTSFLSLGERCLAIRNISRYMESTWERCIVRNSSNYLADISHLRNPFLQAVGNAWAGSEFRFCFGALLLRPFGALFGNTLHPSSASKRHGDATSGRHLAGVQKTEISAGKQGELPGFRSDLALVVRSRLRDEVSRERRGCVANSSDTYAIWLRRPALIAPPRTPTGLPLRSVCSCAWTAQLYTVAWVSTSRSFGTCPDHGRSSALRVHVGTKLDLAALTAPDPPFWTNGLKNICWLWSPVAIKKCVLDEDDLHDRSRFCFRLLTSAAHII